MNGVVNKKGYIPAPRADKNEYQARVKMVALMMLSGATRSDVDKYCLANYNIRFNTIKNIVRDSYTYISENYKVDREKIVDHHIQLYYDLLKSAKEICDVKGAIAALNQIEKLFRLHNPEIAIQNNTLMLNAKDMDVNELKQLLNQ